MKQRIGILLAFIVAIVVAVALRHAVFGIYLIPHDMQAPVLRAGDRVLVRKRAYYSRLHWPWSADSLQAPAPKAGDWVAFHTQATEGLAAQDGIGCLMAGPGDTVWTGPQFRVSPVRNYARGCIWPLVVPGKGVCVEVTPWNVALYARTINAHEGTHVSVQADRLLWNGRNYRRFRFRNDYYWIYSGHAANLHDSRSLGFLPREAITGQATTLLYSLDPERPWYGCMRTDRLLQPLGGKP